MNHTTLTNEETPCNCEPTEALAFIDTSTCSVENEIIVDLYKKPTDRCQYLLPSSCHPPHITDNIPFSLAYRIIRICTQPETRDKRLTELKNMLVSRDYKANLIDKAIDKAKNIPRQRALERVTKSKNDNKRRPVLSVEYHPALPPMSKILLKHWRVMVQDPYLKDVFPLPPMVAYRRPANLKEKLVRARIPPITSRPKRNLIGMKKCQYDCNTCPYIQTGKVIKSNATNYTHEIERAVNCQTKNVVYCISCDKCDQQYVGENGRTLALRFSDHRGYVRNEKFDKPTGEHFNLPGHNLADMKISIVEKVLSSDPNMRKIRESHFIEKLNTFYKGMNKKK